MDATALSEITLNASVEKRQMCSRCGKPAKMDLCPFLPLKPVVVPISNFKIIVLQCHQEHNHPKNTASLLQHVLHPSQLSVIHIGKWSSRTIANHPEIHSCLSIEANMNGSVLMLFPSKDSHELPTASSFWSMTACTIRDLINDCQELGNIKVDYESNDDVVKSIPISISRLLVLDGSWGFTQHLLYTTPVLHLFNRIKLKIPCFIQCSDGILGGSIYRELRKELKVGCSTMEAIAYVVGALIFANDEICSRELIQTFIRPVVGLVSMQSRYIQLSEKRHRNSTEYLSLRHRRYHALPHLRHLDMDLGDVG